MKKFEAMERVQAEQAETTTHCEAGASAEGGLTEAQLLEVFKQTSVFTVRGAGQQQGARVHHARPRCRSRALQVVAVVTTLRLVKTTGPTLGIASFPPTSSASAGTTTATRTSLTLRETTTVLTCGNEGRPGYVCANPFCRALNCRASHHADSSAECAAR